MTHTNLLLGYPADARLLILNADDFGMCHAVNAGIFQTLRAGLVRSTTLMVPCPWALHAVHYLQEHPHTAFGVHLTAIDDGFDYRWGPLNARDRVPSLVDETGFFYRFDRMREYLAQVKLDELELEFRAQIEYVLAAGLRPTHLDWHSLRLGSRPDLVDLIVGLAKAYGLALRVIGQPLIDKLHSQGLPAIDHDFLDTSGIDPAQKADRLAELLRELPAGLNEWAVHPGLDSAELLAIEPDGNHFRQADVDFWTSPRAKDLVQTEGITLLDYRALQQVWQGK
jgi:predicted glycoside hydrolase/deacetylase ChbG (UPF0249 family)